MCVYCGSPQGAACNKGCPADSIDRLTAERDAQQGVIKRLVGERDALRTDLDEWKDRAERAEYRLLADGYREHCDIPACNCGNQWAHGGHARRRLREVSDALEGRDNGVTILEAVEKLVRTEDEARAEVERLKQESVPVEELREFIKRTTSEPDIHYGAAGIINDLRRLIDQHTGEGGDG